tara:strand:- start:1004 stop:1180 length:177 start_codon:yes stop_codon:yes gene_type:complete
MIDEFTDHGIERVPDLSKNAREKVRESLSFILFFREEALRESVEMAQKQDVTGFFDGI